MEQENSLIHCVARARENARGIRDAISSEMWEELNVLHLRMQEEASVPASPTSLLSLLQRIRTASHMFQGLRDNTMVRSDEWHFLCLGQYVERGDITARLLEAMFFHPALEAAEEAGQNIDTLHLVATLQCCTGFEAYTRTEPAVIPARVAEFLLLDARFPRSVEFCVQEVGHALHALSGTPQDIFSNDAEQQCGRLVAELRFAEIDEIMAEGFQPYLQRVIQKLVQIGFDIRQLYFP
jgi:uncharacterized alpha-E superfamily protein